MRRSCFYLVLTLIACSAVDAWAQDEDRLPPGLQATVNARDIAMAVITYANGSGALPRDIRALSDGRFLPEGGLLNDDGSAWVADGTPFEYIGVDGVSPSEVPDWADIVVAHASLDHPFMGEPHPDNPNGSWVAVAFLDGHAESVSVDEARWLIDESRRTMEAIRDGAPLPMYRQLEQDAARLAQAMRSFASKNEGIAPPDWASTFEVLRLSEPDADETELLKIYLAPRARDTTFIPSFERDEERHEWINTNSMWESHAHGANLWRVPNPAFTVLLSARPDAWVRTPDRRLREHVRRLAFAMVDMRADLVDREVLDARRRESSGLFDAIRDGTPLPPLDDAMHDLRALSIAIADYAKANDGYLPGDLGELVPYLRGLWGVHEREPARVFLIRSDESVALAAVELDAEWVRTNGSYVYLGDPTVRLRDLRGSRAGILIHAPLDRPFLVESSIENDKRVPFVGPPLGDMSTAASATTLPMYLFPAEFLEQQAADSREAIEALSQR